MCNISIIYNMCVYIYIYIIYIYIYIYIPPHWFFFSGESCLKQIWTILCSQI